MYDQYYALQGRPFQLTPDPHFYYESATHRKALSYLGYGLAQGEGFIVVTGDVGAGKTTILRALLAQIPADRIVAAQIVSTQLEADDLVRMVARAFGIPEGTSWCVSWQAPYLIRALYEAGRVEAGFMAMARRIIARFKPWYVRWPGTLPRYLIMGQNGRPVPTITEGVGPGIPTWDADARYIIAELGL